MKISIDDQELITLSETQKKIIANDIASEVLEDDLKRRIIWILVDEKLTKCYQRLKAEWEPKLIARGVDMIPTKPEAFAELVFSQSDYENRSQRDARIASEKAHLLQEEQPET